MKIDLHCHTLNCKKGDGQEREVNRDKFIEKVNNKNVSIVAITNHNKFDINQYNEFQNEDFQVWPGIELDVKGKNGRGHLIIISNPIEVKRFDFIMKEIINEVDPNDVLIDIETLCQKVKNLDILVICHYFKKPDLTEMDFENIKKLLGENIPFFCEPTNLITAGIFLAHNVRSILGSDVKNWDLYDTDVYKVPELKLPVDSFDRFKLLLQKDYEVIHTFLNQKKQESIMITPFENKAEKLNFELYNDINVFFGGRGTGKTKILEALEQYYNAKKSNSVSSYYGMKKQEKYESIVSVKIEENSFSKFKMDNCTQEIQNIKKWQMQNITTTDKYYEWIKAKKNNKKKFGFLNVSFNEVISSENYNKIIEDYEKTKEAIQKIKDNGIKYLEEKKQTILNHLLDEIVDNQIKTLKDNYCYHKSLILEEYTIMRMKELYKSKKGEESKPNSSGLSNMFSDILKLYNNSKKIVDSLTAQEIVEYQLIGKIADKGYIYNKLEYIINPEKMKSENQFILGKNKLTKIRDFYKLAKKIMEKSFKEKLDKEISYFSSLVNEENIYSISKVLSLKTQSILSEKLIVNNNYIGPDDSYSPSNGEQAMLVLQNSILDNEKDVFILDEPEIGVGHDYINHVIVPRLNELARLNKTVIISTHDANVAVRTLPYLSVYRVDLGVKKKTYIGNPFLNKMVNQLDSNDSIIWNHVCLENLEGGENAFEERGKVYGK